MASEARFIRVAFGPLQDGTRGEIAKVSDLGKYIPQARTKGLSLFRSYYRFDAEMVQHFDLNKSAKGFKGKAYVDRIKFDIDRGKETDQQVLERARAFVKRLSDDYPVPQTHIRTFFSGSGYHIEIPDIFGFEPSEGLALVVSNTFKDLFPEADNIYDKLRLLRVANTINEKTNLFKVPLTMDEFYQLGWVAIHLLAATPRPTFAFPDKEDIGVPMKDLIKHPGGEKPVEGKVTVGYQPTSVITCVQNMFNEGAIEGSRHAKILRIASAWRRQGMPYEAALSAVKDWAPGMSVAEVRKVTQQSYEQGYSYSCNDPLMSKFCDTKCMFYNNKDFNLGKVDAKQMETEYVKFLRTDFSASSLNLANIYNLNDDFWMYPGEFITVWGDTGVGKSAWVQNIIGKTKLKTLVLSLENHQHLFFRRQIQIAHHMTKQAVNEHYKLHTNNLSKAISHINVITTSPKLNNLKRIIIEEAPQLVVVDTLDGVIVDGAKDDNAATQSLATTMKAIAQQLGIIIMGVHHISKNAAQDQDGKLRDLTIHSGKGSSSMEQKADKVIVIEGDRDKDFRRIKSLKARDEAPFLIKTVFDKETFIFSQIAEHATWPSQPELPISLPLAPRPIEDSQTLTEKTSPSSESF